MNVNKFKKGNNILLSINYMFCLHAYFHVYKSMGEEKSLKYRINIYNYHFNKYFR